MQTCQLGPYDVTEVGLGTWNIGADWGDVSDEAGREAVRTALDAGVTFLDTADVYGDGRSERHIATVLEERDTSDVVVATKAGRRLDPTPPRGTTTTTSRRSSTALGRTSTSTPSISSSCTVGRRTRTTSPRRSRPSLASGTRESSTPAASASNGSRRR